MYKSKEDVNNDINRIFENQDQYYCCRGIDCACGGILLSEYIKKFIHQIRQDDREALIECCKKIIIPGSISMIDNIINHLKQLK